MGKEIMSGLIRKEDALNCFHDWVDQHGDVHTADEMPEYRAIEALPTVDAVEVVRCRDCKYQSKGSNESESWNLCGIRPLQYIPTQDHKYCADGDARMDGDSNGKT